MFIEMKSRKYKDMTVPSGTKLYEFLEDGDMKSAEAEYKRLNDQFHKEFPKEIWDRIKGGVQ